MPSLRYIAVFVSLLAAGCAKEPPPRSVAEFIDNPLLLEAALVRCTQDRAKMRYEAECVNAREAVRIIEAEQDAKRRAELEAQSERKREALRRTQRAAAEARRRAEQAAQRREDEAYLAQFGPLPEDADADERLTGNMPGAVIPSAADDSSGGYVPPASDVQPLPTAGSNAPVVQAEPEPEPQQEAAAMATETPVDAPAEAPAETEAEPTDLQAVRDELRRRNEGGDN